MATERGKNTPRSKRKVQEEEVPEFVEISTSSMMALYGRQASSYHALKAEVNELLRRVSVTGGGPTMKQLLVRDPPLLMLTEAFDTQVFAGNITFDGNPKSKKKLCLDTPSPVKKSASDTTPGSNVLTA